MFSPLSIAVKTVRGIVAAARLVKHPRAWGATMEALNDNDVISLDDAFGIRRTTINRDSMKPEAATAQGSHYRSI